MSDHQSSDRWLDLGIIGLGQIGGNLAKQADDRDIRVVGMAPSKHAEIQSRGITVYDPDDDGYDEFVDDLSAPRVVYISVPAGELVDETLDELADRLDEGDVVIDGGNSFWRDSMRRADRLHDRGIYLLDAGTSGGLPGARNGACFMVGGDADGYETAEPVLDRLSVDGGLIHTGPSGSGHFVKLVHNGVEFGMLQAIAEGVELLEAGQFDLDLAAVFHNWNSGSVVRSWLVQLMAVGLDQGQGDVEGQGDIEGLGDVEEQGDVIDDPPADFGDVPNYVEDTGEVNWLVQEAIKGETPIPVITQAVIELFKSRGNQRHTYRAIALMRRGFGNHPFGENEDVRTERLTGRVENEAGRTLREHDRYGLVGPHDSDAEEDGSSSE